MRPTKSTSWFTRFAKWTARETGRPATFVGAVSLIVGWACTGPLFGFSDTWQLVINTGTTIITFRLLPIGVLDIPDVICSTNHPALRPICRIYCRAQGCRP
jgi:hypothetical protein